jgi:hypothetical protein
VEVGLETLAKDKPHALAGIVEGDETFILESFKGKRSAMPRKARKRGGKPTMRGISADQPPVAHPSGEPKFPHLSFPLNQFPPASPRFTSFKLLNLGLIL